MKIAPRYCSMVVMDWVLKASKQLFVAVVTIVCVHSSSILDAQPVLDEDFDSFGSDAAVEAAGWRFVDVNAPLENATRRSTSRTLWPY